MRENIVYINKSNGAYLIDFTGDQWRNGEGDKYDCASSLVLAKRIAREEAIQGGYCKLHWTDEGYWVLSGELEGE